MNSIGAGEESHSVADVSPAVRDFCASPIDVSKTMLNLHRVFDLWFDDPQITPVRKLSFADDLRDRLAANNSSGAFDLILPQLDTALTAAGGATSSEAVARAVRKAAVQAKVILLAEIKTLISRRSGRIVDDYGKNSVQYTEFFPQGLTAYRDMPEAEVEARLDTILAAAAKYDAPMQAEFATLKTQWLAASQAAGDRIAAVSAVDGNQNAALAVLDSVLMKAVLTAGLAFTGNTAMGPILFDQSRLFPAGQPADDKEPEPALSPA